MTLTRPLEDLDRVRAHIDAGAIAHNLAQLRLRLGGPAPRIWATAKADAYGHGLARALPGLRNADGVSVQTLADAHACRDAGWDGPILVHAGLLVRDETRALTLPDLHLIISHADQLSWLAEASPPAPPVLWLRYAGDTRLGGFDDAGYARAHARAAALVAQGRAAAIGHLNHYARAEEDIATRITRPLDTLTGYARSLPEQDLTAPAEPPARIASLPSRHRDEVGRLASSFLFMQRKLGENVARLMDETSARERIESELNIARDIQLGLLPMPLPREVAARVELQAAMQPAKEVGGDLYDYFTLPDGRLCFAIGDVSGKGVPAALFMAVTRTLIRATAESETDPALIVQRVNNRLSENNPNMMFVTLLLGVLDLATGELAWANAGHPPPAVVAADGTVRLLPGRSGPACGVQEDLPYQRLDTRLQTGETLVGYTDGVTDASDRQGTQYGEARMLDRLGGPALSAQARVQALLDDVHRFADGADPFDDITLIAIRCA